MRPWSLIAFGATLAEKWALDLSQVPREVWGGLAGGALGGLAGHGWSQENRRRNALLGVLGGAAAGAAGAHVLGGSDARSSPSASNTRLNVPGPSTAQPQRPEPAKINASAVEPILQQSEARTRQAVQQQALQQAVQLSSARERAAILKDQGRVGARMQALLAPRETPAPDAAAAAAAPASGPRNTVIAPGTRVLTSRTRPTVSAHSGLISTARGRPKTGALHVDPAHLRALLVEHPRLALRLRHLGRGGA